MLWIFIRITSAKHMFLRVLNTVFLNISNYLPHLDLRNRSIQTVIVMNFVVISNVSIKRFDCNTADWLTRFLLWTWAVVLATQDIPEWWRHEQSCKSVQSEKRIYCCHGPMGIFQESGAESDQTALTCHNLSFCRILQNLSFCKIYHSPKCGLFLKRQNL